MVCSTGYSRANYEIHNNHHHQEHINEHKLSHQDWNFNYRGIFLETLTLFFLREEFGCNRIIDRFIDQDSKFESFGNLGLKYTLIFTIFLSCEATLYTGLYIQYHFYPQYRFNKISNRNFQENINSLRYSTYFFGKNINSIIYSNLKKKYRFKSIFIIWKM